MPTLAAGPVHLVGLPAPPVAMRTIRLFSTGDNDASPKPAADPTPAVKPQANLETEKETLGERFERLGDSIKARFLPKKQVTRIFGKMEYVEPIDGYVFYQADEKALAKFRNSMIFPSSMMATTLVMLSTVNWPTEALAIWLLACTSWMHPYNAKSIRRSEY